MQAWSLVSICVLFGLVVRWGVSLNAYSGMKCVYLKMNMLTPVWGPVVRFRVPGYLPLKTHPSGAVPLHQPSSLKIHMLSPVYFACVCVLLHCHSLTWPYIQETNS